MTDENKDQPKPAAPPAEKAAAPEYVPLPDNPILKGLAEHLPGACSAGWDYLGQWIFDVDKDRVAEIGRWLKESQRFDMCADVTAVDWKDRPKRFTMVYNLYSLQDNRRILLRAEVAEGETVPSISGIWSMAAWPEREVFDMFGIRFEGHPDLRRILMPEDWAGHPLRKDYDLRGRNPEWISRHLVIRETGETAAAPNAPASEAAHE